MTDASAPVLATASATVLNTGRPRCSVPPLPGVTPPTTLVPYSSICSAWKVPCVPVKPCTMTLVFLLIRTDISWNSFVSACYCFGHIGQGWNALSAGHASTPPTSPLRAEVAPLTQGG